MTLSVQLDTVMLHHTFDVSVGNIEDHVLFTLQLVMLTQTRFDVTVGATDSYVRPNEQFETVPPHTVLEVCVAATVW